MECDVSVVIPAYNSSPTLPRALHSVYAQSLLPREIIIVDDGSDDWAESQRIASSYPGRIAIRFLRMPQNQGPSTARNLGVSAAQCRFVAFLDADDIWYREKLALQHGLMAKCGLDFSMHDYLQDLTGREDCRDEAPAPAPLSLSPVSFWSFVFGNPATPTVMALKHKLPSFDTSLRRCEDWKCWMEALASPDCKSVFIRRVLAGGFKPGCGVLGLSRDLKAMHASKLEVLQKLADIGKISAFQRLAGAAVERVKYPVRILRVSLRNRKAGLS